MLLKAVRGLVSVAVLAAFVAMSLPHSARAQDNYPQKLTFVIGGGLDWNMVEGPYYPPASNPASQPPAVANQVTQKGNYNTPAFHLGLEIPIVSGFMLAPRLAYNDLSAVLDVNDDGTKLDPALHQDVAYAYKTVGLEILGKITPLGNLHFLLGPTVAEKIKNSYSAYQGTDNVEAASTSTTEMPGKIDLFATIKGGVGYDIPLTTHNSLWLTPELTFAYPLTNIGGGYGDLIIRTVQGAISLKFNLGNEEAVPTPAIVDLGASIRAKGVLNGEIVAEPAVPQQALHNRASMPLLPYVFFDENAQVVPTRYSKMGSTGFNSSTLAGKDALDANHALLDIIGERMQKYNTASIKITGTNSNTAAEKGKIELSKSRAMAVRDYLVNTWHVDAGRITVDQRNLPELPTNPVTKAGQEENRRVEIASTDARVTEPVKIEGRDAVSVGETVVRFETSVSPADHTFSSWTIKVDDNGQQVGQTLSGSGAPPATADMTIPDAARLVGKPLHYTLNVTDPSGRVVNADGMTHVVNRTVDRENLEKFAMLSFDFDRAEINQRAQQMLSLIGESISRDATGVTVSGYCDNTGTDEYNQALSEARANSAVTALRSQTRLPANTNVRGYGERDPKFNNDLPEGRQLNRRVEFTIEKSSR